LLLHQLLQRSEEHGVSFGQLVSLAGSVYSRSLTTGINLMSGANGITPENCETNFDPGTSDRGAITLFYPFDAQDYYLNLRRPQFGNAKSVDTNALVDSYRNGRTRAFKASTWPTTKVLSFTLAHLTDIQKSELEEFFEASQADEVGIIDWENKTWRGVFLNDEFDFAELHRSNRHELALRFMGELA